MKTTRREFIRKAGLASACVCTGLAGVNGCSMIGGTCQHNQNKTGRLQFISGPNGQD